MRLVWIGDARLVGWRLRLGAQFIGGLVLTYFNSTGLLTCWRLDGETCLGVGAYAR